MGRAGREVGEERLVGRQRLLGADPGDRLVRHVGGEVVVRVVRHLHLDGAVDDQRRPLIGLAADEAVELVEPGVRGPAIERPRHAHLPRRRLVILPERRRAVAVLAQDLGQGCDALRPHAGVPRERGRELHDRAGVVGVVVAAGEDRHARRRAERRRVEAVVLEPRSREPIERRHRDAAAERRRMAEPDVVDQEDDHVGRARGRLHLEARRRLGIARIEHRGPRIDRLGDRQDRPIDPGRASPPAWRPASPRAWAPVWPAPGPRPSLRPAKSTAASITPFLTESTSVLIAPPKSLSQQHLDQLRHHLFH